jgi:hypothetical protein
MQNRLFDKNNYSAKTIETYEILSAYYVDIFYNYLYIEAKKLKANATVSSITEGYKHTLNAFLKGLNNPKLYKKSLVGIHHYFINIGLASITFSRCVDKITAEFIPTDYFTSLSSTQKMGVLRKVISQSIKRFIRKIVDEHMVKIIDKHKEKDNVRILQDVLIDCFILEREGMYQLFINKQTTSNQCETVNLLVAEKMQQEIKLLVKEKYAQKKQIIILTKAYNMQKNKENKQTLIISKLTQKINSINDAHNYKQKQQHLINKSSEHIQHLQTPNKHAVIHDRQQSVFQNDNDNKHAVIHDRQQSVFQNDNDNKHAVIHDRQQPVFQNDNDNTQKNSELLPLNSISSNDDNLKSLTNECNEEIHSEDSDYDTNDSFIEVNHLNVDTIVNGDSEYLQHLNDSQTFKMDEGTTLDDFS